MERNYTEKTIRTYLSGYHTGCGYRVEEWLKAKDLVKTDMDIKKVYEKLKRRFS